ncbi:MAG: alpha/beta fold hydrolase [Bacteroidota bacterium]
MVKKIALGFIILVIVFLLLQACVQFRESTYYMLKQFPGAKIENLHYEHRNIRYMSLHRNDTFPTIFFLHGSPSSMSVYNAYFEDTVLAQWANILAADRPGYGYSDLGMSERSVKRQAELMWRIIENNGSPSPLYIVGSSYGGTVAAKMAMLKPDKVDGMVLVSASVAPGEEKIYRISYLLQYPPFKWIIPRIIRVANDEKLSHYEELTQMLPWWERITTPVILIHGTEDNLIYPSNAYFAVKNLINSKFVDHFPKEGEGHFLQIRYKDFILQKIKQLIDLQRENPQSDRKVSHLIQ